MASRFVSLGKLSLIATFLGLAWGWTRIGLIRSNYYFVLIIILLDAPVYVLIARGIGRRLAEAQYTESWRGLLPFALAYLSGRYVLPLMLNIPEAAGFAPFLGLTIVGLSAEWVVIALSVLSLWRGGKYADKSNLHRGFLS